MNQTSVRGKLFFTFLLAMAAQAYELPVPDIDTQKPAIRSDSAAYATHNNVSDETPHTFIGNTGFVGDATNFSPPPPPACAPEPAGIWMAGIGVALISLRGKRKTRAIS